MSNLSSHLRSLYRKLTPGFRLVPDEVWEEIRKRGWYGPQDVDAKDQYGRRALFFCLNRGCLFEDRNFHFVKALVEGGARVGQEEMMQAVHFSPVSLAVLVRRLGRMDAEDGTHLMREIAGGHAADPLASAEAIRGVARLSGVDIHRTSTGHNLLINAILRGSPLLPHLIEMVEDVRARDVWMTLGKTHVQEKKEGQLDSRTMLMILLEAGLGEDVALIEDWLGCYSFANQDEILSGLDEWKARQIQGELEVAVAQEAPAARRRPRM